MFGNQMCLIKLWIGAIEDRMKIKIIMSFMGKKRYNIV